ncbi:YccF domain-containing protein [Fundicoccus sp. Sow4_D5]|uniref:YccF domain-containing protein n=1 Tax=unclassified Fundicoccus TaxID=2761543 RepID=UPI003F9253C4
MSFLGNIIWLIFGGLLSAIAWTFVGILWSVTIVGLPIGLQCFKIARLSLSPFGKHVEHNSNARSLLLNILWLIFGGIELAIGHLIVGLVLCLTVVGIPFGKQFFKLAHLSLVPFGATIRRSKSLYLTVN